MGPYYELRVGKPQLETTRASLGRTVGGSAIHPSSMARRHPDKCWKIRRLHNAQWWAMIESLVKFSVDLATSCAVELTNAIAKQIPFAMAKALNQPPIHAKKDIVQLMTHVFASLIAQRRTLDSTYIVPATKEGLESLSN